MTDPKLFDFGLFLSWYGRCGRKSDMKNESKTQVDEEMGYFFGFPKGTYSEVLGELRRTWVNSCKTSSIPLADFWRPENLGRIKALFAPHLPGFDPASALKFFEFPTEALHDGKPIGSPSMTDIMVIAPSIQMAVEGKFTEYVKGRDQTVGEWLAERKAEKVGRHSGRPSQIPQAIRNPNIPGGPGAVPAGNAETFRQSREAYLRNVIRAWFGYIRQIGCTGLADDDAFFAGCMDVSYQFLHRSASACCKADIKNGAVPVLVYQLFFDAKNARHIEKMEQFKANLRRWAETLKLRNMKFLIVSVPVVNVREVEKWFKHAHGGFFTSLRNTEIYDFDFDGVTVEEVIFT